MVGQNIWEVVKRSDDGITFCNVNVLCTSIMWMLLYSLSCMRSLCNRIIVAAIEKKDLSPPYQMPLIAAETESLALVKEFDQEYKV